MGTGWKARQMTFRPMPILTALTLISLVILVLLGNWQYDRYSDKIDNPTTAEEADTSVRMRILLDLSNPGNAQQVYGFASGEPIWRRYVPGTIEATGEPVLAMVEATGGATPLPIRIAEFPETATFYGLITAREPSNSAFAAKDDPEADTWYALNPPEMAKRLGMPETTRVAEPVMMTVRNAANLEQVRQTLNPYAFAKPVDPLPPERHFGYALTWWGMALGLIGVYLGLHYSQGRLKFTKT